MTTVKAKPGESFESLLRRFKKAVDRSGVLSDFRKREFYEKPSIKKKKKRESARKRVLKKMKKMRTNRGPAGGGGGQNYRFNKDKTEKIPMVNKKNTSSPRTNTRRNFNPPKRTGK